MRRVRVYRWEQKENKTAFEKVEIAIGYFHEFGVDYEELEFGVGNYSTALVEMPDKKIVNVPVELITFID